jgi:4-alpha-glucanotransferase
VKRASGTSADASPALLGLVWSSVAALAIAPLQDVLDRGNDARMNQPGSAEGSWRWRYTEDMLSDSAFQSLQELTHASARTGGLETPRADAKPLTHDLPALLLPEVTR